jgi:bifunctional non-homologous end joining protein LigD
MLWSAKQRTRFAPGFVEPCLPTSATKVPIGPEWAYEIKHDGYRFMVRRVEERVRIFTRRGHDWTERFPRVVAAVRKLRAQSLLIDGEGVVCDAKGVASFDRLHSKRYDEEVSLCGFDLLEINGEDFQR